ncbi:MAG TPA: hypothetical protein VLG39_11785 [Nitrospirota bacterium]|nr:hypothetical protein [Nitrospirota bacterium]
MKRLPVYECWGMAVTSCNYGGFKRPTGERERRSLALPCGRSVCSGCQSNCAGQALWRNANLL